MYCRNGPQTADDENASAPVTPLYMLPKSLWWFHHVDGCDQFPPPEGQFLELPAGKEFTVEIASNRATTTLSYDGQYISDWVDGQPHTDAFNETMAAGTAFAISYQSDLSKVTPENLVVFSVRYHTPWKRLTSYAVPSALPACPPGGCICAWGWVPNGCGQPNIYHQGFRCKVTGATSMAPVAVAKPPVWCEGDASKCTKGAKQMIYWNQLDGNNVHVSGYDFSGNPKSPAYSQKLGFFDGAQNDIFAPPSQGYPTDSSSGSGSQAIPSVSGLGPKATSSVLSITASSVSMPASSVSMPASSVSMPASSVSVSMDTSSTSAILPTSMATNSAVVSGPTTTRTTTTTSTASIRPPAAVATQVLPPASGGLSSGHCHHRSDSHSNGTRSSTKRGIAIHRRRHRRGPRIDSTSW
ncbi:hypothetical protein J132_03173 [Termitomyces sp. J132]|nr:hypothetical protein J132_03173 [Termitomyces sp. J132]